MTIVYVLIGVVAATLWLAAVFIGLSDFRPSRAPKRDSRGNDYGES